MTRRRPKRKIPADRRSCVSKFGAQGLLIRRIALLVAVVALAPASVFRAYAGSLSGVTLPDTIQVGGTILMLNGLGLRTKYMVKVYVAGLYLPQKSSDPNTIVRSEAPKRIVMQFVRSVSKSQIADAFDESFSDNAPDTKKAMKVDIDRLFAVLEPVKDGDQMVFTYVPGAGTTFTLNGKEKVTIAAPSFGQMLFSVWLGPKPPNAGLKKGLLGQ